MASSENDNRNFENPEQENLENPRQESLENPEQEQQLLVHRENPETGLVPQEKQTLNQNFKVGNKIILAHLNQWDPGNINLKYLL